MPTVAEMTTKQRDNMERMLRKSADAAHARAVAASAKLTEFLTERAEAES